MASTHLNRAFSSSSTNTKATWSLWVKRGALGSDQFLFHSRDAENNTLRTYFSFTSSDTLKFYAYDGSGNFTTKLETNRKFRDTSAWYHIVFRVDTTQGNVSHRVRIYVNNEEETSFSDDTYPSTSEALRTVSSVYTRWGKNYSSYNYFDGILSHVHFIEGEDRTPDYFGETDSVTGEWKINTSPTGFTYGSNGYFILKDGNSLTDQSGNSNNFTLASGTLTKTEDCPSNVFATMATPTWYDGTIANGGNTVSTNQSNYRYQAASLGVSSGKWYWEVKLSTAASWALVGITDQPSYQTGSTNILGSEAYDYAVYYGSDGSTASGGGHLFNNNGGSPTNTPGGFMGAISQGDIFTFALDLDSATKKLYIGINGSWSNGSNATDQTFANSTGKTITAPSSTNTGFYFPAVGDYAGSSTSVFQFNFGNGYFGTTAVSSAGTNASGIGIFEHDVPAGYTALSTKGLNE